MESARILRISQPAVSKMVRLLEEDLGVLLLHRRKKGIKVTEEGEILFQAASRIFSEANAVSEKLRSKERAFTGEWNIGVSDNVAIYLAPRVLGRFKEKHPELRVGLFSGTSTQIKSELMFDRSQLGIFFTPIKVSEPFESRQIFETEFWAVIAKNNRWVKNG